LNSTETGRPRAIIEGSIISAKRTGASAALAAQQSHNHHGDSRFGVIGAGPINFEVARFLLAARSEFRSCSVFDVDPSRARQFADKFETEFDGCNAQVVGELDEVLRGCSLLSVATNASRPHINDLSQCLPGTTILHVSLRDLDPEIILSCDNILDDIDHVCRAQTSVHLAEQLAGSRDFLRCTLGEILNGAAPPRRNADGLTVFSPFGLGILDLAVSTLVCELAEKQQVGTVIESFLPEAWV
jgi:ornithine cyclodeaminase